MSNYYLTEEDSLKHYGILGMKWGQRNFQNPDGTYTELGKIRRRKSDSYSADEKRKRELAKKPSSQLSNKELRELNERYNLENQRKNWEKHGKNWVEKVIDKISEQSAQAVAGQVVAAGVAYLVAKGIFRRNW